MMRLQSFVVFLVMLSSHALAEPSASVRWLMNEPASMFDIGMLRTREAAKERWCPTLDDRLVELKVDVQPDTKSCDSVVYDWKENRIVISMVFKGSANEEDCGILLQAYRDIIFPLKNQSPEFATTLFAGFFDHVNYSSRGGPSNWQDGIVDIVRVSVGIKEPLPELPKDTSEEFKALSRLAGGKSIFCSSSLRSDRVSYTKYGF